MLTLFIVAVVIVAVQQARAQRKRVPDEPPPPKPAVRSSLASVREHELVRLTGRVRAIGEPMASPITGTSCIACLSRAQVWHSRKIPQLIEDLRDARIAPFALEVADGLVLVDNPVVIEMKTSRVTPRSPEDARALLAAHKLERFLPSSDFEEALIQAGDEIAVVGVLVRERLEAAGYRELAQERMKVVADPRHPVTLSAA